MIRFSVAKAPLLAQKTKKETKHRGEKPRTTILLIFVLWTSLRLILSFIHSSNHIRNIILASRWPIREKTIEPEKWGKNWFFVLPEQLAQQGRSSHIPPIFTHDEGQESILLPKIGFLTYDTLTKCTIQNVALSSLPQQGAEAGIINSITLNMRRVINQNKKHTTLPASRITGQGVARTVQPHTIDIDLNSLNNKESDNKTSKKQQSMLMRGKKVIADTVKDLANVFSPGQSPAANGGAGAGKNHTKQPSPAPTVRTAESIRKGFATALKADRMLVLNEEAKDMISCFGLERLKPFEVLAVVRDVASAEGRNFELAKDALLNGLLEKMDATLKVQQTIENIPVVDLTKSPAPLPKAGTKRKQAEEMTGVCQWLSEPDNSTLRDLADADSVMRTVLSAAPDEVPTMVNVSIAQSSMRLARIAEPSVAERMQGRSLTVFESLTKAAEKSTFGARLVNGGYSKQSAAATIASLATAPLLDLITDLSNIDSGNMPAIDKCSEAVIRALDATMKNKSPADISFFRVGTETFAAVAGHGAETLAPREGGTLQPRNARDQSSPFQNTRSKAMARTNVHVQPACGRCGRPEHGVCTHAEDHLGCGIGAGRADLIRTDDAYGSRNSMSMCKDARTAAEATRFITRMRDVRLTHSLQKLHLRFSK